VNESYRTHSSDGIRVSTPLSSSPLSGSFGQQKSDHKHAYYTVARLPLLLMWRIRSYRPNGQPAGCLNQRRKPTSTLSPLNRRQDSMSTALTQRWQQFFYSFALSLNFCPAAAGRYSWCQRCKGLSIVIQADPNSLQQIHWMKETILIILLFFFSSFVRIYHWLILFINGGCSTGRNVCFLTMQTSVRCCYDNIGSLCDIYKFTVKT